MRTRACWLTLAAVLGHGAVARAQTIEYYALDAIGSVRVVFDASGAILGRMDYGPFGQELIASTGKQKNIYAGLFAEGEAGLDYAQARMYQARVGRFSSVDPVFSALFQPQEWNRYAYAANNPLGFIDPEGLDICFVGGAPTRGGGGEYPGNQEQPVAGRFSLEACGAEYAAPSYLFTAPGKEGPGRGVGGADPSRHRHRHRLFRHRHRHRRHRPPGRRPDRLPDRIPQGRAIRQKQ